MSQDVISAICRAHARGLEEICLSLPSAQSVDNTDTTSVELQDFVAELLREQAFLRDLWQTSVRKLATGWIVDPEAHGKLLIDTFDRSLQVFERVKDFATHRAFSPSTIAGWDEFERGCSDILAVRRRLVENWPRIDEQRIRCAEEQVASGDVRTARDLLDELQHSGSR